jgi:hypothetical protein
LDPLDRPYLRKKVGTGPQYDAAVHSDDDMRRIWQNWLGRLATEDPRIAGLLDSRTVLGTGVLYPIFFPYFFSLFVSTPPSSYSLLKQILHLSLAPPMSRAAKFTTAVGRLQWWTCTTALVGPRSAFDRSLIAIDRMGVLWAVAVMLGGPIHQPRGVWCP